MRRVFAFLLLAMLAACGAGQAPTELVIQRFFGACQAEFGNVPTRRGDGRMRNHHGDDNQFEVGNPDITVTVRTGRLAGLRPAHRPARRRRPPDLVTMHSR